MGLWKKWWVRQGSILLVGVAFSVVLGWLTIQGIEWGRVRERVVEFPLPLLALAVVLLAVSGYLRAVRWRVLWAKERVSALRLFWVENAAIGLNNVSPVRALDEPLILGILTLRDRLPGGTVVATVVVTRVLDMAFSLAMIGIAVATLPVLLRYTPIIVGTSLYFVILITVLLNLQRIIKRFPRLNQLPGISGFQEAIHALKLDWRRTGVALGFTIAYWLILGPITWAIAEGVGLDIDPYRLIVVALGAIFFSTVLPGLPGALGTFEFAAVTLLEFWGAPKEEALSFAIILHSILFVPPSIVAVVILPREGIGSIAALRRLLNERRLRPEKAMPANED